MTQRGAGGWTRGQIISFNSQSVGVQHSPFWTSEVSYTLNVIHPITEECAGRRKIKIENQLVYKQPVIFTLQTSPLFQLADPCSNPDWISLIEEFSPCSIPQIPFTLPELWGWIPGAVSWKFPAGTSWIEQHQSCSHRLHLQIWCLLHLHGI